MAAKKRSYIHGFSYVYNDKTTWLAPPRRPHVTFRCNGARKPDPHAWGRCIKANLPELCAFVRGFRVFFGQLCLASQKPPPSKKTCSSIIPQSDQNNSRLDKNFLFSVAKKTKKVGRVSNHLQVNKISASNRRASDKLFGWSFFVPCLGIYSLRG